MANTFLSKRGLRFRTSFLECAPVALVCDFRFSTINDNL